MTFIISAILGWALICFIPIEYKTVIVYPTLDNLTKIQYKDNGDNCFEFTSSKTECTTDAKEIEVQ